MQSLHVRYNEFKASIKINDLALMNGYLPPKALGLVIEWAAQHIDELLENWNLAINGEILNSIKPL